MASAMKAFTVVKMASAAAGGARGGPRALGPPPQEPQGVDVGDAPAAGAHAVDVHHLDGHAVVAHPGFGGAGDLAVPDKAHVEAGAAHVHGEEIGLPSGPPQVEGAGGGGGA